MKINGKHYHTIWLKEDNPSIIQIIDQRSLPHEFTIEDLTTVDEVAVAIKDMHVRGAPLIGVTAAYGMYLAVLLAPENIDLEEHIVQAAEQLKATRPTAVNLFWAINKQVDALTKVTSRTEKIKVALKTADWIKAHEVENCRLIGEEGVAIIEKLSAAKNGDVVNILTHCNAGWMACIDYGTATAPIYAAHEKGIKVHVWVDETRPRNQGARITAFELKEQGVPHTVIPDNVGGHLMQHDMVDMVIVGSDRTTYTGDVANKIGTYLKALAAKDNEIPFYAALPSSTFDWTIRDGVKEIPIENRGAEEVKYIQGLHEGKLMKVLLTPEESPATNYAFDVTPAHLVTGLITEKGICAASEEGVKGLFPEKIKPSNAK